MLVLAGVEFIFFIVASIGLCFGFVLEAVVIDNTGMFSLLLSSAYTELRPFLLLTPPHQRAGWGVHKKLGGDTAGTADPN